MPTTVHRPELGPIAQELIDRVHREAPAGGGVPLIEVVELFGFQIPDGIRATLEGRGDIVFAPQTPERGAVSNRGPARAIRLPLVQLLLPRALEGRFTLQPDGFALDFDRGGRIGLKKLLLKASITRFALSRTGGALKIDGPLPDIAFTW